MDTSIKPILCPRKSGPTQLAQSGISATASELHRGGVTQVVAYFGPVYDRLSTWAETAFYREISEGARTRDAVRAARWEMTRSLQPGFDEVQREVTGIPDRISSLPFGWAQLVLYQRGPDFPLGTKVQERYPLIETETTERVIAAAYPGSRTQVLLKGFLGRRREMHALRRDLKKGRHQHVVQGLGGMGKSAFCTEALKVYQKRNWQPIALWCADLQMDPDPATGLLRQFTLVGEELLGDAWHTALALVDRHARNDPALQQPSARLGALLDANMREGGPALVLYLDNLESMMVGPEDDNPQAVGKWRDEQCAALWHELSRRVEQQPGKLALLASCRYQHPDLRNAQVSFRQLPDDALWRLMGWFPALRRLSLESRGKFIERLAGHPRSVEFLEQLIKQTMDRWEETHGDFAEAQLDPDREWQEIVEPVLPGVAEQLSEDLLFGALWDRVLDSSAQHLLVRATVLREPGSKELLEALAGFDESTKEVIDLLCKATLLTEVEERQVSGAPQRLYEVHPMVIRLALQHSSEAKELQEQGHRRAGEFLEAKAESSRNMMVHVAATYHLRQAGEVDRAFDLAGPLVQWLSSRGRNLESAEVLGLIGDFVDLEPRRQGVLRGLVGGICIVQGDLAGALASYRASLEIAEKLVAQDPSNTQWQRDLSVGHTRIGDVLLAQGDLAGALTSYRADLGIAEKLAAQDPSNTQWQRDLTVSHTKIGDVHVSQGDSAGALASYRAGQKVREELAAQDPSNAEWQRDLSVSHNRIGDVLLAQGDLAGALASYRAGLEIAEKLAAQDPSNAEWQRGLTVSHTKIGDLLLAQGDLAGALTSYRAGLEIAEKVAAQDPSNAQWQRDISVSHNSIGDVLFAQGDLAGALTSYRAGLKVREELAAQDPSNAQWQRDLSISHANIGDVLFAQGDLAGALTSYRADLGIAERLAAQDPSNAEWQRDLSVKHNRFGDALRAQGDLAGALASYRASLEIAEKLVAQDPSNAQWQRGLTVSHSRIGVVLFAQGDLAGALTSYRAGLKVREELAAQDPSNAQWQRDLSISHTRIGDVLLAQGDLAGALTSYRADLGIAEKLAAQDPSNTQWQRDLTVSHTKIGDVHVSQGDSAGALAGYRASLEIAERLAAQDPSNAQWQRDLTVSHAKIGDVLLAQGDLAGALTSYRAGLEIAEKLAAQDPSNAQWQRDLTFSHNRIGDVLLAQGDSAGALASYRAGLKVREELAAQDPSNAEWQRDLSVSHNRIGDVLLAQGDLAGALTSYRAGLEIAEKLAAQDPSNAQWQRDLTVSHTKIGDALRAQGDWGGR